jgi:putative membrane protein
LIVASVFYVGKTITKWTASVVVVFLIGAGVAIWVSFMNPATENESFIYLLICGVVAVCSMILPGLSGSFVLILMGNYELVMINAVNEGNIGVLAPVILGGIIGILALSHILSWVYKKYKDQTISILTGFILGSLSILWPWKIEIYRLNSFGEYILKDGKKLVQGYDLYFPDALNAEVILAIVLALVGFGIIALMEKYAGTQKEA